MARDPGGYTPPPTQRDVDQSVVHHGSSVLYNLQHAKAHVEEAIGHAKAQQDRLARKPRFQPHVAALGERMADDDESREAQSGVDDDESAEREMQPRSRPRAMGDDGRGKSLERFNRKTSRGGGRR